MRVTIGELLGKVSAKEGDQHEIEQTLKEWAEKNAKEKVEEAAALQLLEGNRVHGVEVVVRRRRKT